MILPIARRLRQDARILVVRLDGLGDCILSSGFFAGLRVLFPRAHITGALRADVAPLFAASPSFDTVLAVPAERDAWTADLLSPPYDLAICPRWDVDFEGARALALASGAPIRVGFDRGSYRHDAPSAEAPAAFTDVVGTPSARHEVEKAGDLLRFLGATGETPPPRLDIPEAARAVARGFLDDRGIGRFAVLGVAAGRLNRMWPAERLLPVVDLLHDTFGLRSVVVGGANAEPAAAMLVRERPDAVTAAPAGLPVLESAALIAEAALYVGMDSGPMHMAAACGVPVVEISCHPYSGTPDHHNAPRRFGPWGVPSRIIRPPAPLPGCDDGCGALDAPHCITRVPEGSVLEAVRSLLGVPAVPPRPLHIHIGHTFFGAGNFGDDLVMAGFLTGIGEAAARGAGPFRITCAIPHDIESQRRRFPEVEWHVYDPAARHTLIDACDVWLGLGGSVLQPTNDGWLLSDLAIQLELCRRAGKPVYFLGSGIDYRDDADRPEIRLLLETASWIWTRDGRSDDALHRMGFTRTSPGADLSHLFLETLRPESVEPGRTGFVCVFEDAGQYDPGRLAALVDAAGSGARWLVQEVRVLERSEEELLRGMPPDLAARLSIRRPDYGTGAVARLVEGWGRPEALFSTRFHGTIVGAWAGSRVVAFERAQKLAGIAADLGIECLSTLPTPEELAAAFARARPVERAALAAVAARARSAIDGFVAALRGGRIRAETGKVPEGGMNGSTIAVERHTPGGMESVPAHRVRAGVKRGEVFVVRRCLQAAGAFEPLRAMVLETIEEVSGASIREVAAAQGLDRLHALVPMDAIMAMNPIMAKKARRLAASVVRDMAEVLGLGPDVHFEDGPNVRIFTPHDYAADHADALRDFVRRTGAGGRLTLHGPHQDDRHFHPLGAINIWCAIDRVEIGNGMSVYPEFYGHLIPYTERDANIRHDQYLGRPVTMALDPGDALVFETLQPHGSTINQTDRTRFVISFRVTQDVPRQRSKKWYSYVRPDDCGPDGPPACEIDYRVLPDRGPVTLDTSGRLPPAVVSTEHPDGTLAIPGGMVPEGEIRPVNADLCVARVAGQPVVFFRGCPHEGADLAGGSIAEGKIVCPWHGLRMNTVDGSSGCRSLGGLEIVPCREVDGQILVEPVADLTENFAAFTMIPAQ